MQKLFSKYKNLTKSKCLSVFLKRNRHLLNKILQQRIEHALRFQKYILKKKIKLYVLIIMHPILTFCIFFIFLTTLRLYFYDFLLSSPNKCSCEVLNFKPAPQVILITKEASQYGVEILTTCYNAIKNENNITQQKTITLFIDTFNKMPNKAKWGCSTEMINAISMVIQLRACQALQNNDPDYIHLLLLQVSYHIFMEKNLIIEHNTYTLLFETYHTLNEKLRKKLYFGFVKILD